MVDEGYGRVNIWTLNTRQAHHQKRRKIKQSLRKTTKKQYNRNFLQSETELNEASY